MTTVKCQECYPSPVFPFRILYTDKRPPKVYEEYKKWDRWFTWRYLLELREDPEDVYQIGNLETLRSHIV